MVHQLKRIESEPQSSFIPWGRARVEIYTHAIALFPTMGHNRSGECWY